MKITFIFFCFAISLCSMGQNGRDESSKPVYLPSILIDGRFFLKMPTLNHDTVLGFCDTGGGYTAIYYKVLQKLKLETKISQVDINGEKTNFIYAKDLFDSNYVPYPTIGNYYKSHIDYSFFEIPDTSQGIDLFSKYVKHDVFLGQFFFINKSWTFDYKSGKLYVNTPVNAVEENTQSIGFKKDRQGNKRFGHPSMQIVVDGKTIDVLFDTGATLLLGENSETVFSNKKAAGGSFIARSIFDIWHQQHPDWRVIEKGEITGADLIEVPEVTVGNLTAGPVWFAKRPDEAWSRGMIGSMDKVVEGAIGGSFLQYFKVSIDYNSELIKFQH